MQQELATIMEYPFHNSRKPDPSMHTVEGVRDQCALALLDIAPRDLGEKVTAWFHRVALRTGLKAHQVKRLHYREVPTVPAHIADMLRDAAAKQRAVRERAEALKAENDRLLDQARKGARMDWSIAGPSVDAIGGETPDARQLEMEFRGWRK